MEDSEKVATDEDVILVLEQRKDAIAAVAAFLDANSPSQPVACHLVAAKSLSECMMTLMSRVASMGGSLKSVGDAADMIASLVGAHCETVVEDAWFDALASVESTVARPSGEELFKRISERQLSSFPSPRYLHAYRAKLFLHIVKNLGPMTCNITGVPGNVETYFPKVVQQVVDQMYVQLDLAAVSSSDVGLFQNLMTWTGTKFSEVTGLWCAEAVRAHDRATSVNLDGFRQEREKISKDFLAIPCGQQEQLDSYAGSVLNSAFKVPADANMFPEKRAEVLQQILAQWDKGRSSEFQAQLILDNPLSVVSARLVDQFRPAQEVASASGAALVPSSAGAPKQPDRSKPRLLSDWWQGVVLAEEMDLDLTAACVFDGTPWFVKKAVIAALNNFFSHMPSTFYTTSVAVSAIGLLPQSSKKSDSPVSPAKEAKESYDVVRFEEKPVELDIWGRVLDASAAASASKSLLLPLYLCEGKHPCPEGSDGDVFSGLFLDGSSVINTKRSDCCVSWLIKAAPEAKSTIDLEAELENENNSMKKAKIELKIQQLKAKRVIPTHDLSYKDFEVDATDDVGVIRTYHFRRPVLVNSKGDGGRIVGSKCHRQITDWDRTDILPKRQKVVKAAANFVLE